jgi:signal peptidase II
MSRSAGPGSRWPYFVLAAIVLAVDQATKVLAHAHLRDTPAVPVVPGFFDLSYSRNPGGLFGYFGSLPDPWRGVLLTALPVVAVALIVVFLLRSDGAHVRMRLGLASILGGAVGNLVDRVVRGEVVDFFDVYVSAPALADWLVRTFGTAHWPTFNVADSCIVTGAGLLILDMLRAEPRAAELGGDAPGPSAREREHG